MSSNPDLGAPSNGGEKRLRGRIRRLKNEKKYGWIAGDDGVDYFFHAYGLKKNSPRQYDQLQEQDRLEFTPVKPDEKGPRAIELTYLDE